MRSVHRPTACDESERQTGRTVHESNGETVSRGL